MGLFSRKKYSPSSIKADRITRQSDMVSAGYSLRGRSVDGYGKKLICSACGHDSSATYGNDKREDVVICQNCDAILNGVKFAKKSSFHELSTYP